jgi:hypothetical protein
MRIANRIRLAVFLVGAFGTALPQPAFAQGASQQRVPSGMEGAGGVGGAGGGAVRPEGVVVSQAGVVNRNSPYVSHVRSSTPPPMDPSRRIYEVDCTRPFDSVGKGNLRCL